MNGKLIIPRLIACFLVGFVGVTFIFAVFVKALEQVWMFIDSHPLYTGFTVLALFSCYGIYWLVKRLRQ